MPMNAYTGATGAGKTYQVVEHLICVEIAQGRSLVTNIENIDLEGVYIYILCKNRDLTEKVKLPDGTSFTREKIVRLGTLRVVSDEEIENSGDDFFPSVTFSGGKKFYDDSRSVVKNGEYIVMDEAANWWGEGVKILPNHAKFFREHRHFVNPVTWETCDIVFIVQDVAYLHRSLRRKGGIRYTFWVEKLDMVGLVRRYKMLMYSGASISSRSRAERVEHGEYKEEIYLLYDSTSGGQGKEKLMDARQNILNNSKKFKLIGFGVLIFCIIAFFMVRTLISYFSPKPKTPVVSPGASQSVPSKSVPSPSRSTTPATPPVSEYRVVGWYRIGNHKYVTLRLPNGSVRTLISPQGWYTDRLRFSGRLEDKLVTEWSGNGGKEETSRKMMP